ncbi:15-hydroxyprostaglandin dehydrogenase, partial [Trichonephila clavipes]
MGIAKKQLNRRKEAGCDHKLHSDAVDDVCGVYGGDGTSFRVIRGKSIPLQYDGPTNLERPTLNNVQNDTMVSAVLSYPTSALQGTNRGRRPAMDESENDVRNFEQLLLYADEQYLAGKLTLGDHLGK